MNLRYAKRGVLRLCLLVLWIGVNPASLVWAQGLMPYLHYQGRLTSPSTDEPLEGIYTMAFRLYEDETGGAVQWSEIKDVTVSQGLFSTLLGDTTALDTDLFDGRNLWLAIKVGDDAEAAPRQRIAPVAYSLYAAEAGHAANAAFLEGLNSDNFARETHLHDDRYVRNTGPESISGSDSQAILTVSQTGSGVGGRFTSTQSNGLVGSTASEAHGTSGVMGMAGSPGVTSARKCGVLGYSDTGLGIAGFSGSRFGVYGWSRDDYGVAGDGLNGVSGKTTASTGIIYGVNGEASAANSMGVRGINTSTTGVAYGVHGKSNSTSGTGVYGLNETLSGTNFGVRGVNNSSSGGAGVRGDSTWVGVWGESTGRWGVYGRSSASNGFGIYGTTGVAGAKAGQFQGDVQIVGTLTKSSGSFMIDHPLDPENKYLLHSFVESPDMMNIYNGNTVLDDAGQAWVELPTWFLTLNQDFRYQLTSIGGPGPNLYIANEVEDNRFQIAGGTPGLKVSWQVTGIRNDPYAKAHRIPVEMEKPPEERGTYLHPVEYGVDRKKGLSFSIEADWNPSETAN